MAAHKDSIVLRVTQADIDEARPGWSHCPLNIAARRQFKLGKKAFPPVGTVRLTLGTDIYACTTSADFTILFDNNLPVQPQDFVFIWHERRRHERP